MTAGPLLRRLAAFTHLLGWSWYALGRIFERRAQSPLAALCYRQSLGVTGVAREAHFRLGRLAFETGDYEEATAHFAEAASAGSSSPETYNYLGLARLETGQFEEAAAALRTAFRLRPDYYQAHSNLGNIELQQGHPQAATDHYGRALNISPHYTEALNNMALALLETGHQDQAEDFARRALRVSPDFAGAWNNLGNILLGRGKPQEAIACYQEALDRDPDLQEAHLNLAVVLEDPNHLVPAIDYVRQRLRLAPDSVDLRFKLGMALSAGGNPLDAIECYREAMAREPTFVAAHNNLGLDSLRLGLLDEAMGSLRKALEVDPGYAPAHSNLVFAMNYSPRLSAEEIFWAHVQCGYQQGLDRPVAQVAARLALRQRRRVGYVSGDLRRHSVAYFVEPVLANHDPSRFEVYCYSSVLRPDEVTERLQGLATVWRDVACMTREQVADLIRQDGIDILVDLSGHTANNRLDVFALKPAPIQVTYLGYPNTTGLTGMDYRLTDALADPPGEADRLHTEALVRMPECFLCYGPPEPSPHVAAPPACAVDTVTFGSFNALVKLNEDVVKTWGRILEAAPGSRLVLKHPSFADEGSRRVVLERFACQGLPRERVTILEPPTDTRDHLEAYHQVDIALDPFPYNGTTTTCEALWMGVPVVALAGERHAGRVGVSLLTAVGLAELIAGTRDDYVRLALSLAGDLARLSTLRRELRARMRDSVLMDAEGFTQALEQRYQAMFATGCEGARSARPEGARGPKGVLDADPSGGGGTPPWVFIIGMPRSGSTWAYNVTREVLREGGGVGERGFLGEGEALDSHLRKGIGEAKEGVPRIVRFHEPTAYSTYLLNRGHARAIFTQRDLRDVAASLTQFENIRLEDLVNGGRLTSIAGVADTWHAQRHMLPLEYQDVQQEPADVIENIAGHLGVPLSRVRAREIAANWTREALAERSGGRRPEGEGRAAEPDARQYDAVKLQHTRHVFSGLAERYRQVFTQEQIRRLDTALGDWLARQGYADPLSPLNGRFRRSSGEDVFVSLNGDLDVCVPDSLEQLTPYVLLEQGDWFEDEIGFVRRFLAPGMRALDVGASYGVYALTLAEKVLPGGQVWAFEPASRTVGHLDRSRARNRLDNLHVEPFALSNRSGGRPLALEADGELNRLLGEIPDEAPSEEVVVRTLDQCAAELGWTAMDFVRLHVEGEETRVVQGGKRLFSTYSPLVMAEIKHGQETDLSLVAELARLGYHAYRLAPGPGVLLPVEPEDDLDGLLLNLFCCKPDMAKALEGRGLLARRLAKCKRPRPAAFGDLVSGTAYGIALHSRWQGYHEIQHIAGKEGYLSALGYFAMSRDEALAPGVRLQALVQGLTLAREAVDAYGSVARKTSLARMLADLGLRAEAATVLAQLVRASLSDWELGIGEPFLAVCAEFEQESPLGDPAAWARSAVLRRFEKTRAFSSYFTGQGGVDNLLGARDLGYSDPETDRRIALAQMRAAGTRRLPADTAPTPPVSSGVRDPGQERTCKAAS